MIFVIKTDPDQNYFNPITINFLFKYYKLSLNNEIEFL